MKSKIFDKYNLHEMRVFGSSAHGDRRIDSDIDIFVQLPQVTRQIEEDLFDIAYELELKYDCLIDLIVFSDQSITEKYDNSPIYKKILAEGTLV